MKREASMSEANPMIKCRKCGMTFAPDVKTIEAWRCPNCKAKNPNLKRHYRSVADLFILGLIIELIVIAVVFINSGLTLGMVLTVLHTVFLFVTIVIIYKSKTPWADSAAKTLIWIVFGLGFFFNVVVPLILAGRLNIPFIIVYAIVFPYLFWLNAQARKCTASEPPMNSP